MTYDELVQYTKDMLEADETTFNSHIDDFIKQAEEDIFRQVQLPDLRKNSTSNCVADISYIGLPDDYLSPYSFSVTDSNVVYFLQNRDVNFMREAFPDTTTRGRPRFFAQFDDANFIIAPTPDDTYSVELHYFYKPASLADGAGSGTTWLSENGANALLYGTVLHGYTFLKGDQDVQKQYASMFQKGVTDLKLIAEGRTPKDTYREPDQRIPV